MNVLVIDDMRVFDFSAIYARTYDEGIRQLKSQHWDLLVLDHDLGEKKSGYDIMCWLERHQKYLPYKISCCSSNPVGKKRIEQVINKLYKE